MRNIHLAEVLKMLVSVRLTSDSVAYPELKGGCHYVVAPRIAGLLKAEGSLSGEGVSKPAKRVTTKNANLN